MKPKQKGNGRKAALKERTTVGQRPAFRPAVSQDKEVAQLKDSFANHLKYSLAKDEYSATRLDCYTSVALTIRDRLIRQWIETQQAYYKKDVKRVYYLSLEFLIGRTLGNSLINLGLLDSTHRAVHDLGYRMEDIREMEFDAGLGNGGLGRLAACFMDSLATLQIPAYGYGIRYEYGIFFQKIIDGYQVETADNWLRYGNPWEIERPEFLYIVRFYGRVEQHHDEHGSLRHQWVDTRDVAAVAFDTPIPGFRNNTVNTMRLWSAKSTREFDLEYFNHGDYERAVSDKAQTETISKVLYPNDNVFEGKELRLKQEYFFVSATIQDIIRRYKKTQTASSPHPFAAFPDKVAIHLNDTHPAIGISELMRIFLDIEGIGWDDAWDLTVRTFGYTNHTILPEALEKWPVTLFERVLPRHMQIIFEINRRFLDQINVRFPNDVDRLRRMSVIEEGYEKRVRMANLSIIGSHSVNGVSALHSDILKAGLFRDFYEIWPERFSNKTNGITQRRWLMLCNPGLAGLITDRIGEAWTTDLYALRKLRQYAKDPVFRDDWREVKHRNKRRLAGYIAEKIRVRVDPDSLFDCHVKRMHEYKRQLLNVLHVVSLYNRIKADPSADVVPRTVIFAGKAAPGYHTAKLIIKLINSIADVVNSDPYIKDLLKVVFISNYSVSMAAKIIPAADLSEQISTAGTEASGTGNMKFALNGALTVGTLDGANIEIMDEVGEENIFIFGHTAAEIESLRQQGYDPGKYYGENPDLRLALDMIAGGYFCRTHPELFRPVVDSLLRHDPYMVLADFAPYVACQEKVGVTYKDKDLWTRKSILNVANMGFFSADRTVKEYADGIWGVKSLPITFSDGK
ncbi:MAG: glycogen/starch/alpha-glucan phosphorylase [Nitrospiraceae bacterium]|nr:glycogen/starch/alpha-glucan phosphorylase [Nitrospiraceae bacterium]